MATRSIVPRADGEGSLGTETKRWGDVRTKSINGYDPTPVLLLSRKNSTAYAVGDVAFSASLPSYLVLECTTAGTTAATEPDFSGAAEKDTVTDGTVVWTYKNLLFDGGDGIPIGAIIPYSANGQNPAGYLTCDGSAVSRTMYPDLFAAIGTTYGDGDGATTFNLPDLTGRFLEGDATAGTVKQPGLPNIVSHLDMEELRFFGQSYRDLDNYNEDGGAIYVHARNGVSNGLTRSTNDLTWVGRPNSVIYLSFNASLSNPIYGASDTVQPPALTVRYIIKAFDGQTPGSALIDITQYAQELTNKATKSLDNLTQDGEDHFLGGDNFTIIYPNGGSESNPANIAKASQCIEQNPFPGYFVACCAEVLYNGVWISHTWASNQGSGSYSYGVSARQNTNNNTIVVTAGTYSVIAAGTNSIVDGSVPMSSMPSAVLNSIPCRVKVWKIGKQVSA